MVLTGGPQEPSEASVKPGSKCPMCGQGMLISMSRKQRKLYAKQTKSPMPSLAIRCAACGHVWTGRVG